MSSLYIAFQTLPSHRKNRRMNENGLVQRTFVLYETVIRTVEHTNLFFNSRSVILRNLLFFDFEAKISKRMFNIIDLDA